MYLADTVIDGRRGGGAPARDLAWGFGFRVEGLGLRVEGLTCAMFGVECLVFGGWGLGFGVGLVWDLGDTGVWCLLFGAWCPGLDRCRD